MAPKYQSEIRQGEIRELALRVKDSGYNSYLRTVKLNKIRAFTSEIVNFDFPVTALIGTNGGGKSTILGAAAIAYKDIRPATFFPKSSIGDDSMVEWSIGYDLIEKTTNKQSVQRRARFKKSKWARDDVVDRPVLYFGIFRTVPAGERKDLRKIATTKYNYRGSQDTLAETVKTQVEKILGKDVSKFIRISVGGSANDPKYFYIGGNGSIQYSEFHFGAGESSIIRMVEKIESAPVNALVLIEEIENGLHPVAVRRMVEYLMDAAKRRSIQTIFTTHSDDALLPLPPEAIWASIDGKPQQGYVSIEALRAITGQIPERMAIFVEDGFAKEWVESIIRNALPEHLDEIGVYEVQGEGRAYSIHKSHKINPSLKGKLTSICIVDGKSSVPEDVAEGVIRLPGSVPEDVIFGFVRANINELAMRLAIALHLPAEKDSLIKKIVEDVAISNRDSHLLFTQVGKNAGYIASGIVSSAFIGLWLDGNKGEVERIANFIKTNLTTETHESKRLETA